MARRQTSTSWFLHLGLFQVALNLWSFKYVCHANTQGHNALLLISGFFMLLTYGLPTNPIWKEMFPELTVARLLYLKWAQRTLCEIWIWQHLSTWNKHKEDGRYPAITTLLQRKHALVLPLESSQFLNHRQWLEECQFDVIVKGLFNLWRTKKK
jgi:hypothetical protein